MSRPPSLPSSVRRAAASPAQPRQPPSAGSSAAAARAAPMFVFAFSPGVPAFTQPEESHQALAEGVAAPSVAPGAWSSVQKLSDLYATAVPSNDLTQVGLLVHGFDGTEKGWPTNDMWHPCTKGWCKGASDHWSASIISRVHKAFFSDAGIVYAPDLNAVLCSAWNEIDSLNAGCSSPASNVSEGSTYPREQLQEMLQRSFTDPALKFVYNEVLVDSHQFVQNLPGSVGAFIFGMTGKGTMLDQMQATAAYVNFLDAYKLTEKDVPLLQLHHTGPQGWEALTDESAGARKFVQDHPRETWLEMWYAEHPDMNGVPLDKIPEVIPAMMQAESEALAKVKTARAEKAKAPTPAPADENAAKKAAEKAAAGKAAEKAEKAAEQAAENAVFGAPEDGKAAEKADEEKTAKQANPSSKPDGGGEPAQLPGNRAGCKAIEGTRVNDGWCIKNCGSLVPFCPTDQCECEGGNPIAYTDNMTAPAQAPEAKLSCKAVEDDRNSVTDAWCMLSCNPQGGAPPNCPSRACKCKGGNPTSTGMPAHLTPEEYEQWKENEEKKKHAQSEVDKSRQSDIAAEQEAKKVAARDAAAEAAAKREADREEERERVEAERQAAAQAAAQANGQAPVPASKPLPAVLPPIPARELTDAEREAQTEIEESQRAIEAAHKAAQQADHQQVPAVTPAPPRELTDAEMESQREIEESQRAIEAAHKAAQQAAEEVRQQTAAEAEKKEADRAQADEDARLADPDERLIKDETVHTRDDGHKWHKPKPEETGSPAHRRDDGHKWHAKPEAAR